MTDDFEIRVMKSPWSFGVDVMIRQSDAVAKDIVFENVSPDACVEPLFNLNSSKAQLLMDELWQAGFRPSEGTGSAGALSATEKHLNDMRKLVFNGTTNG